MVTRDTPWPDGTPCWVDLGTNDIQKAISFYSSQFGWDIQQGGPEVGGYSMAKLDGRNVAAVGPLMGPPGTSSAWATYFASSDADATAARIKSAGGQLVMEPTDVKDAGRISVMHVLNRAAIDSSLMRLSMSGRTQYLIVDLRVGARCTTVTCAPARNK